MMTTWPRVSSKKRSTSATYSRPRLPSQGRWPRRPNWPRRPMAMTARTSVTFMRTSRRRFERLKSIIPAHRIRSAGGVHIAGLGALWQALIHGFACLDLMGILAPVAQPIISRDAVARLIERELPGWWWMTRSRFKIRGAAHEPLVFDDTSTSVRQLRHGGDNHLSRHGRTGATGGGRGRSILTGHSRKGKLPIPGG